MTTVPTKEAPVETEPTETEPTETLPEVIDLEAIRLSILVRTGTGFTDPSYAACKFQSGELLKSAVHTETVGTIVFEMKYGLKPGYRTVVLTAPDAKSPLKLMIEQITEKPVAPVVKLARVPAGVRMTPAPVATELDPADALSTQMSYSFHVRSLGDHHVICSTNSLHDAKRIVAALPNCAVFQYRTGARYDNETVWMTS